MKGEIVTAPVRAGMYFMDYRFDLYEGMNGNPWSFFVSTLDHDHVKSYQVQFTPQRDWESITKTFWEYVVIFFREDYGPNIKGL